MTTTEPSYDLVVIGGGPAGCAAAIVGRERGLRVALIERDGSPRAESCPGWLGPAALEMLREWGVVPPARGALGGIRLWSWELRQHVDIDDAELAGCIVNPVVLGSDIIKAARKRGAKLFRPATVEGLQLGEHNADVFLSDGRHVTGTIVLIADGADSTIATLANMATTRQVVAREGCAGAVLEAPNDKARLDVVLGGGSSGMRLVTVARAAETARVSLLTRDNATPATEQLKTWIAVARDAELLPPGPPPQPAALPRLAGTAIEMESHVGKRCLLIGDAGGFVTAFSNEGMYPALQSGGLAAQAAADALAAPILQDELATFSARWRENLAEYLRMPNTDLGLLLPMVFKNPQMSHRLARAFLLGQAF